MTKQPTEKKLMVLGIDGMDPRITARLVEEGRMPNTKKMLARGSARKDLVMLGGVPTVTPPMWTTLSTGAFPVTHGITGFSRLSKTDLDVIEYNLDSANCQAEQLWNVFAEAGKKTLVFHWPGSSWPPTSDSPNLHVVDGTQPAAVNMGVAQVESEFILVASDRTEEVLYREKASSDTNVPCVITDLEVGDKKESLAEMMGDVNNTGTRHLILERKDGQGSLSDAPFDVVLSPIKPAKGWEDAPENAKEFTMLFSHGTIRRVGLILANEQGIYDHVALFKSKKEKEPIAVLQKNVFVPEVIDEAFHKDQRFTVNRNMRVLELADDGNYLKMWISAAMNIHNDDVWHPKRLYKTVVENVGYPSPEAMLGGADPVLIRDCMAANWDYMADWQANALHLLIEQEEYQIVFSHFHNIDAQGHMIVQFLKDRGHAKISEAEYMAFFEDSYVQADRYLGEFLHYLDEGWTIFVVSDHAQVCPEHEVPMLGDGCGVDVRVMEELGFTALKKDENGNELREIDWENTRAIAKGIHIHINLKGRDKYGIVAPEDQYEVEEELITALYGYKHKVTGKRIVSLAMRNKDAVLIGLGGPECGDVIIFLAEGYNYDHSESLSTTYGYGGTSVSPIFFAAGHGIKENFQTDRLIREVDLTPTMAILGGVRMPAQCEGAPIYQILTDDVM